jgi:flavin reductase (DIM6/NTAB) family NADH-FMN oxidoreductase RutF
MIKELDGTKSIIYPLGVFIIGTYDENGVPNCMNAAWGIQSGRDEISFFLGEHKTTENLKATGDFTVALSTRDTCEISDYFGLESGKNVNKIEKAGCHAHKAPHVNAPILDEFPVWLECQVKDFNEETGHLQGKIVGLLADDSVLTDDKLDIEKLHPILFDSSSFSYRELGPVVGHAYHDGKAIKEK